MMGHGTSVSFRGKALSVPYCVLRVVMTMAVRAWINLGQLAEECDLWAGLLSSI